MNWGKVNWGRFTLEVFKSTRFGLGFAIVSTDTQEGVFDAIINAYCKFQLAHTIRNPVIIFQLDDMSCVGAPLFNKAPHQPLLYHIPKENYPLLDDAVSDKPFIVSDKALNVLEGTQGLMGNIYKSLEALHHDEGLIVVAMEAGRVS